MTGLEARDVLLPLSAFILGGVPFGVIAARARGVDLRKTGSGNIGATNVLRSVGKGAAVFTLLGDILKGTAAVLIGRYFGHGPHAAAVMGLFAVLGHDFSPFMGFKGGKGVAASLGVLLGLSPLVGLFSMLIWLATAFAVKYSSLSALTAFLLLPLNVWLVDYRLLGCDNPDRMALALALSILLFYKHRENIGRLVKGTEPKMGKSKTGRVNTDNGK
jgi:glycerol-3-phosphate acyltransferase PlsY